ncbi:DUF3618 domain-containing protein [Streptomyces sp. AM 4-1-1]|uniref:DUF3618 domain-containing protein n=1 Tax=unclassified Streptomyces TaxID=2593676 RepID=UPI0023B9F072|nr:DUF3618 domain-containing protein [Streptomyces sp. AM 4-1-1]WEH36740.1 DUF3618 domain-containing protein [Streptomyces sp. AM 4-1-1]
MNEKSHDSGSTPSPEELRERVEGTRDELGRTVEALTAKADVKARARDMGAELKDRVQGATTHARDVARARTPEPVREKAGQAAGQLADAASSLGVAIQDNTPDAVQEKAARAMGAARDNRGLLIGLGVATLAVVCLVRRARRG